MNRLQIYKAIVIGVSAGGMNALKLLLPAFPEDFPYPLIIVQHIGRNSENTWINLLNNISKLTIKEAEEKEKIEKGFVYIAPANYHLLVENDYTFSLTVEARVNYARPSIDVLFETAAYVYKDALIGIILTGSQSRWYTGIKKNKRTRRLNHCTRPSYCTIKLHAWFGNSYNAGGLYFTIDRYKRFVAQVSQ